MLGKATCFTMEQTQDFALANRDIVTSEITAFKSIPSDESAEHCLGLTALGHPQYHTNLLCAVPFIYCPYLSASREEPNPEDPDQEVTEAKEIFFSFLVTYWYLTVIPKNSSSSSGFPTFPQSLEIPTLKAACSRSNFGRTGLNMKTIFLQTHKDFQSKQCCTLQNCNLLHKFVSFLQRIKVFNIRGQIYICIFSWLFNCSGNAL